MGQGWGMEQTGGGARGVGEPQGDAVAGHGGSSHPVWNLWVPSGAGRLCLKQLLIHKAMAVTWGVGLGPAVQLLEVLGRCHSTNLLGWLWLEQVRLAPRPHPLPPGFLGCG